MTMRSIINIFIIIFGLLIVGRGQGFTIAYGFNTSNWAIAVRYSPNGRYLAYLIRGVGIKLLYASNYS